MSLSAFRVTVGTIWVTTLLATCGVWIATASHGPRVSPPLQDSTAVFDGGFRLKVESTQTQPSPRGSSGLRLEPEAALKPEARQETPRRDLYGNVVEDAVGDYRLDLHGETYEHHAPDIEVTKLGPPSA